ncbi:unnamed protein product [Sphagnum troendelagicum]|uniref:Uncharacterized protein n=1 Tax=Sphagnum troendelagicum TaxID=128251 RepID=A0ABP0TWW8_9BRYO
MAGAAVVPPMSLWPRTLRRNSKAAEGKRKKKSSRKENPYPSTGLESFEVVVTELQAKKKQLRLAGTTGVVEKPISELSSKAPESDKNEEGKVMDMEDVAKSGGAGGGNRQEDCAQEEAAAAAAAAATGCVHREAEGGIFELPWKMRAATKKRRGGLTCVRSKTASKAASAMLVAVGTFLASKRAEFGKGIAAAMTFSVVIRKWRNGKLYARFIFSAMASYFLGHLQHSYIFLQQSPFRSPPGLRIKLQDEQPKPKELGSAATMEQQEQEQKSSSFEFPNLLPDSSSSPPPSPIRLGPAATEMKSPRTHPVSSPKTSSNVGSNAIPSRNDLGRKLLSWSLKSRLMKSFHLSKGAAESLPDLSPTIKTENLDSDAASSQCDAAAASSPKKSGNRFSFSRKPKASSEFPKVAENRSSHRNSKRSGSAAVMSNAQTTNEVQSFTTMACASSGLRNIKTSFLPTTATIGDRKEMLNMRSSSSVSSSSSLERGVGGGEMWLLCGLFIALLFLLMGQVPAILVTSVFFLVLSQLQKWRSSRVGQAGRDQKDVTRRTLEEASRKLHIPSIPGSPVRSPPPSRADINSTEYHKRIIIEGLLERNRKGNS